MSSVQKGLAEPHARGLRMKQLVAATRVPKSTILHYLRAGLLPEPVKTSPNMAYYDPECVNRIRLIRHLQHRHRLSLVEIGRVLENRDQGQDLSVYVALNDLVFGPTQTAEHLLDQAQFCDATGLTVEQVEALLQARLLLPVTRGRFDQEDVNTGMIYARGLEMGVRIEDMTYYVDLGDQIVDHEMAFRRRLTHHLPYEQDAALTIELVQTARMLRAYVIERLFQHRVAAMWDLKDEEEERGKNGGRTHV